MIAFKGMIGTLGELFSLLWKKRLWWLAPVIVLLVLFAVLIILGSTSGVGPFIYTIF